MSQNITFGLVVTNHLSRQAVTTSENGAPSLFCLSKAFLLSGDGPSPTFPWRLATR